MAKVLIVDDSETVVTLMSRLLRDRGHDCITAQDGEMGYFCAKEHRPDLILMDVVMGHHNGFQTCRRLKRDIATKDIPVVLVTGKTSETDEFWGRKMGASDFLRKPVTPSVLLETVSRFVP